MEKDDDLCTYFCTERQSLIPFSPRLSRFTLRRLLTTTRRESVLLAFPLLASLLTVVPIHATAVTGSLKGFGSFSNGQLGNGQTNYYSSNWAIAPEQVAANAMDVASGAAHSLFLKTDGTLWGMGKN